MTQVVSPLRCAAVIGAGTMGRGIVISLANAGLRVLWLDAKGRIDAPEAAARRARVEAVDGYAALADADLVIEAVYENLELKQRIFRELDAVIKPGAILASNTSALDIDAIAAVTARPEAVLGLHFFSPAHIMKLLEIVRGGQTAPAVLDAALALGERMGKVAVVAGNCHGFIGNRMLHTYVREARMLLLEGAWPQQVDAALQGFGFAMGPFRTYDVVGIDLEWRARELAGRGQEDPARRAARVITATRRAAARPSTTRSSMGWCRCNRSALASPVVISATRRFSSAACWHWSTRGRRFSRRTLPPIAATSIWSI
jgi:3-hydroxyacyl-CoA dehydrogenase